MLNPMEYEGYKTVYKRYDGFDNTNASAYYINLTSHLKTDLNVSEILAVTLANWGGVVSNNNPVSIAYYPSSDTLQCLFVPHTFTNGYVEVLVFCKI